MRVSILPQEIFSYEYGGDLSEIVRNIETMPLQTNSSNISSLDTFVLDLPLFQKVREWVNWCVQETLKELGYTIQIRITQSWFNRSDKGMWHHRHYHQNSLISGIFYLTTSGAETWFSTQGIWPMDKEPGTNETILPFYSTVHKNQEVIHKYPTTPGTLILFPSTLDHSVNKHDLEEPRYTISFNTFPCGSFGTPRHYTYLVLN